MCFTGNFALAMTLEPAVVAPVVNHPSLPLDDQSALELSGDDAVAVQRRFETDDLRALECAITARATGELTRHAHRIKGAARLVGATALADSAALLEAAGQAGEWTRVDQLHARLRAETQALQRHVLETYGA